MEKHFWFGTALLAGLLALSLAITGFMCAIHRPTQHFLEQACQAALQDKPAQAQSFAAQAEARWQRFHNLSAAVADHDPLEEVDRLFAQLSVYAQSDEWTEFTACCAQLCRQVQAMIQAHTPTWWNLL